MASEEMSSTFLEHMIAGFLLAKEPWLPSDDVKRIAQSATSLVLEKVHRSSFVQGRIGQQSTFLTLPRELRDHIYELALVDRETTRQHEGARIPIRAGSYSVQPALTKTCRQVREETLVIYYGFNTFYSMIEWDASQSAFIMEPGLVNWLKSIGPDNTSKITDLNLLWRGLTPIRSRPRLTLQPLLNTLKEQDVQLGHGVVKTKKYSAPLPSTELDYA